MSSAADRPSLLLLSSNLRRRYVEDVLSALALPSGTVGTAYADTFTASGGTLPYTWSVNSLPANLTLNPTTGTISGTPTTAGSFSFTVRVIDKASAIADASI